MKQIKLNKNIPIKYKTDIFIAGGGPAGISAGITAAEQGTKVFLAESHSCFGGSGTAGLVPLFMQFGDGENFLASGFGRKIYDRVIAAGGRLYKNKYLSIPAEKLKRIYDDLATKANLDFTFQTFLADTIVENNKIKYAICCAKSGIFAVEADIFIDCTGDGDMAFYAGADFNIGDKNNKTMPGTLCSLWANIDWENVEPPEKQNMVQLLEKAFKENIFTTEDRHHSGMAQTGKTLGSANIGHVFGVNGTDEQSLTKALIAARAYLPEYELFYKKFVKGYQNAELTASGAIMGIRESRRIIGDYILNAEDYLNRQKFDDQIGCYCYEIDIHPESADKKDFAKSIKKLETSKYKTGEHYGIPYRVLTVKGFDNLLVAGRCISTDRAMQSSIRTMPGCFITGQAAGAAAAIASLNKCTIREIDIAILQKQLKKIGAFVK